MAKQLRLLYVLLELASTHTLPFLNGQMLGRCKFDANMLENLLGHLLTNNLTVVVNCLGVRLPDLHLDLVVQKFVELRGVARLRRNTSWIKANIFLRVLTH